MSERKSTLGKLQDVPDQMYVLIVIVLLLIAWALRQDQQILQLLNISVGGLMGLVRGVRNGAKKQEVSDGA
ncbi:MAG: hypothetical protein AB1631_23525 [Acidobacteriota bacterium]